MLNKWKSYSIILSLALAIAIWFSIDGCNKAKNNSKDFQTLLKIHFRDSSELVRKTNKLGQLSTTSKALELTQQSLDKYIVENASLKNKLVNAYHHVSSINTTITNTHIDTIKIPVSIHDTIPCADIDKSYSVIDKFYSFDFKFKNKRGQEPEYLFLNFNVPDTSTDVIGIKKSGFLNLKHTLVSEQVHTNKYIEIREVKTIVKSEAKPKVLKKVAIGFALGIIATIATEYKINK